MRGNMPRSDHKMKQSKSSKAAKHRGEAVGAAAAAAAADDSDGEAESPPPSAVPAPAPASSAASADAASEVGRLCCCGGVACDEGAALLTPVPNATQQRPAAARLLALAARSPAGSVGAGKAVVAGEAAELLEQLSEKRAATRLEALKKLIALGQKRNLSSWVQSHGETLSMELNHSLRKGAASEVVLASRVAGVVVISGGSGGHNAVYDALRETMVESVRNAKQKEAARAAVASALATCSFVTNTGDIDADTEDLLCMFAGLMTTGIKEAHAAGLLDEMHGGGGASGGNEGGVDGAGHGADDDEGGSDDEEEEDDDNDDGDDDNDDDDDDDDDEEEEEAGDDDEDEDEEDEEDASPGSRLLSATVRALALLVTSVSQGRRAGLLLARGRQLLRLLGHRTLSVRVAAGVALALLLPAEGVENPDMGSDAGEDFEPADTGDVVAALRGLAKQATRRRAKKTLREQRSVFRDILRSIEQGEEPDETLTLGHNKVVFAGWTALVRLGALRRALGSGLQSHFQHNELLSDIFGVRVFRDSHAVLAKEAIKQLREEQLVESSAKAKDRAEANKKSRRNKRNAVKGDDDDD